MSGRGHEGGRCYLDLRTVCISYSLDRILVISSSELSPGLCKIFLIDLLCKGLTTSMTSHQGPGQCSVIWSSVPVRRPALVMTLQSLSCTAQFTAVGVSMDKHWLRPVILLKPRYLPGLWSRTTELLALRNDPGGQSPEVGCGFLQAVTGPRVRARLWTKMTLLALGSLSPHGWPTLFHVSLRHLGHRCL